MINIDRNNNIDLYTDYKKCLDYLKNVKMADYKYPDEIYNYHIYTDIKTEKELMVIKSYLATQNLEKTKLIVWSDTDLSKNKLMEPYIEHVDNRIYNPEEEAKGTPLEGTDWLKSKDSNHWMESGIIRFLMPYKMGGIWVDMDVIFFRDFKPILDQEFAYMWGSELDFEYYGPCAAIMNIHKNSEHANVCLEEILTTPIQPLTTCLDKDLLAKVYRRRKFSVFPSVFFDTEWQINSSYVNGVKHYNPEGLGTQIEKEWFTKPLTNSEWMFSEAFCWHWHNTTHKNDVIHPQSKFGLWQQIIDNKLKQIGIL